MEGPLTLARPATRPVSLVALRCRISEPAPYARGVEPLAAALGERLNAQPRLVGRPADRDRRPYADDLREARGCLLEAGGQVEDAIAAERFPLLVGGDCSIAIATLPTVTALRPDAKVLWLDAHGDFNTPATSPSGWLGGMGLAAACGAWDAGLDRSPVSARQVVLCGVRDLDGGERELLERSAATVVGASLETLVYLQNALDGSPVYVHLDPDVLDPSAFPAEHPAPGGLAPEKLYDLLDAVADGSELVGLEVASFYAPDSRADREGCARLLVETLEPLLARIDDGD